ncbi:biotin--[acetyl-CoA-carboxylase] ligase [Citricoccus sp. NPDC055426]|uniref:biotin--[acetyl-CoA-carboxylase] ligase n=1 Tax=Citricoccus sp. NPDC055426 TaxID=3155536 RepID=UPI00342A4B17
MALTPIPDPIPTPTPSPTITWLDHTGSTQDHVLTAAAAQPENWPHLSAAATLDQRSGHGRRGRGWTTPPGTALAVSVVLRPDLDLEHYTWVTLVAAAAACGELQDRGVPAQVKWPNDLLAEDGRKLCGMLASVLPDQSGIVLGMGLNLDFGPGGPPVPTATSVAEWVPEGALSTASDLLEAVLRALSASLDAFSRAVRAHPGEVDGTHPAAADVVRQVATLGTAVTLHLPDGSTLAGTARGLGSGGTLLVEPADRGKMDTAVPGTTRRGALLEVSAADVVHLRR